MPCQKRGEDIDRIFEILPTEALTNDPSSAHRRSWYTEAIMPYPRLTGFRHSTPRSNTSGLVNIVKSSLLRCPIQYHLPASSCEGVGRASGAVCCGCGSDSAGRLRPGILNPNLDLQDGCVSVPSGPAAAFELGNLPPGCRRPCPRSC